MVFSREKGKNRSEREFHPSLEKAASERAAAAARRRRRRELLGREGLEGGKERANVRYWNDEMTKGKIGPNWQDSQEARQTQDSAGQRREQRRWDGEKI